jgi:signal transduction histidine kinase/ActR/RegA family two-component response regulator
MRLKIASTTFIRLVNRPTPAKRFLRLMRIAHCGAAGILFSWSWAKECTVEMPNGRRAAVAGYATALAMAALAGLLRWTLDSVLHDTSQYIAFYPAILLASAIGGRGPGVLALLLGALTGMWFFVRPQGLTVGGIDDLVRLVLFVFIGGFTVLLTGWLRDAQQTAATEAKRAQQANQAKDRLLAMVSHELRSPLVPIMTTARLLQGNPALPDTCREDMETIERNAALEARLIDDLLDLTRNVHGKLRVELNPTDACEALKQAVATCEPDAATKGVRLELDRRCAHTRVKADSARLQQIFWNLVRNAVKFTPTGGSVIVECHNPDEQRLVVSVSDTGAGIAPADLSRIFLAFEQTDAGSRAGGMGLGLAITKALLDLHGGTIRAESEGCGKGARFTVELPVLSMAHDARPPAADGSCPASCDSQPVPAKPLRILLVEDHPDTAKIMHRLLAADGHDVRVAGDIASALKAAMSPDLDLVISDLGLPDGSGLDLMRELRRRIHSLPGIALTGHAGEQVIRGTREAGFAAHLTKPINMEQLEEAIASAMGQRFMPAKPVCRAISAE